MSEPYPARFGDEELDYTWDWNERLEEGETIVGDVTVSFSGGTDLTADRITTAAGITTFWVTGGGTQAASAFVNLLAVTSAGREMGEKIALPIRAR